MDDMVHAAQVAVPFGVHITGHPASASTAFALYYGGESGAARDGRTLGADADPCR